VSVKVPVAVGENCTVISALPDAPRVTGAVETRENGAARPPKYAVCVVATLFDNVTVKVDVVPTVVSGNVWEAGDWRTMPMPVWPTTHEGKDVAQQTTRASAKRFMVCCFL
jgi:hypothetical protein